jgi:hypothetical protein
MREKNRKGCFKMLRKASETVKKSQNSLIVQMHGKSASTLSSEKLVCAAPMIHDRVEQT